MASLRALECLIAVADAGSITEAARLLHLSQPAVSHQLSSLEREAAAPLLRRGARGVHLTVAGRAALPAARRAVDASSSAMAAARAAGAAVGGSLRLACAQSLISVLAPVILDWHLQRPGVAITVRESTSLNELIDYLDADEVDLVLTPGPFSDRFVSTPVATEEVVLVTPPDHPLATKALVRLSDLDGVSLVQFAHGNGLSIWLERALQTAGVQVETVMRTAVTSAAPELAAAGLGVAVCPTSALSADFSGTARSFSPRWIRPLVAVTVSQPDPVAKQFIGDLRRHGVRVPTHVVTQLDGGDAVSPSASV